TGESGNAPLTITVNHKTGTVTVSATNPPASDELTLITTPTPSATFGQCASGGPTWTITGTPTLASLGGSLNTSTGVVTWTPSCGQVGTFGPFTLKATAASGEFGTGTFSITVTHKAGTVTVNVSDPPATQEQTAISVSPAATLSPCAGTPVT